MNLLLKHKVFRLFNYILTFSEDVYRKLSIHVDNICTAPYSDLPTDSMVS